MSKNLKILAGLALTALVFAFSCAKQEEIIDSSSANARKLYIATGQCNSGQGITTFSGINSSRMIARVNLETKEQEIFFDLAAEYQGGFFAPETSAQSIVEDGNNILLLTENAVQMGDRRVISIPKSSPFNAVVYSNDALALTATAAHITRKLVKNNDNTLLFSKSIAVEKLGTNTLRIPSGANPFVNAPAGACATSTTFISDIAVMPPFAGTSAGKIIYAHQGATTALNRIGIISHLGYSTAANCLDGQTIASATHSYDSTVSGPAIAFNATAGTSPTALTYIPTGTGTGKLLVAYSAAVATELNNNTNVNYAIVMYDVTETSDTVATISNTATILYNEFSNIFGISAMAYDSTTSTLYVATASQPGVANQTTASYGYKIEKFTLDLNATTSAKLTLVRENNKPFIERSSLSKCITSMVVGQ